MALVASILEVRPPASPGSQRVRDTVTTFFSEALGWEVQQDSFTQTTLPPYSEQVTSP